MRWFVSVIVALALLGVAPTVSAAPVSMEKFSSCKALNKTYPNGVAETRRTARKLMDRGFSRPAINESVYLANFKRLDRDYSGIVCGRISSAEVNRLAEEALQQGLDDFICEKLAVSTPYDDLPAKCRR